MASFQILTHLQDGVLKKSISLLWPDRKIEEEFIKSFLNTGFIMLQHNTTNVKSEE